MRSVSAGGRHPALFASGAHIRFTHQPGHVLARRASPLIFQLTMDARTAISALMARKYLSNLFGKPSIFSLALTGRALAPGVKATFRDSKYVTHEHDGKFALVVVNKLLVHLESREKLLTTFLVGHAPVGLFPARGGSRRFSSSNGVCCPLPGNASLSCSANSLRHWCMDVSEIPSSRATCTMDFPLV